MKKVLFVDDEPNVVQALRRMLRPMRHEWDMSFAEGPERAEELLKQGSFHVVVTDIRMPNMDNAALLEPDGIVEALAYHHRAGQSPASGFTPLFAVHVANSLVHRHTNDEESPNAVLGEASVATIGCTNKVDEWIDVTRDILDCRDAA